MKMNELSEFIFLFLEKINITNLLDSLTFSDQEIMEIMHGQKEYQVLDYKELSRVYRRRAK